MSFKRNILILSVLILSPLSCEDNILENVQDENNYIRYPFTVIETDRTRTVDFKISDTGLTTSVLPGDDADYSGMPEPMDFTVFNDFAGSDDIVSDNVTGLSWTKCTALAGKAMDTDNDCLGVSHELYYWDDAKILCEDLVYAGFNDWRLPAVSELFSIINFEYLAPAIDPSVFPNTEGTESSLGRYWTGTESNLFDEDLRWSLNFNTVDGPQPADVLRFLNVVYLSESGYVRCVRNTQ